MSAATIAFYATVATIIPVLFLAVAVQGRTYEGMFGAGRVILYFFIRSILQSILRDVASRRPGKVTMGVGRALVMGLALGALLSVALVIIVAGVMGEWLAIYALYQGQDVHATRRTVLFAVIFLVIALGSIAVVAFITTASSAAGQLGKDILKDLRNAFEEARKLDEQAQHAPPGPGTPSIPGAPGKTGAEG